MIVNDGAVISSIGFYIGDPSYVLNKSMANKILNNVGFFKDSGVEGFSMPVRENILDGMRIKIPIDSGVIGIIPLGMVPEEEHDNLIGEFLYVNILNVQVDRADELTLKIEQWI